MTVAMTKIQPSARGVENWRGLVNDTRPNDYVEKDNDNVTSAKMTHLSKKTMTTSPAATMTQASKNTMTTSPEATMTQASKNTDAHIMRSTRAQVCKGTEECIMHFPTSAGGVVVLVGNRYDTGVRHTLCSYNILRKRRKTAKLATRLDGIQPSQTDGTTQ